MGLCKAACFAEDPVLTKFLSLSKAEQRQVVASLPLYCYEAAYRSRSIKPVGHSTFSECQGKTAHRQIVRQRKPNEVNLAREAGVGFCEVQCERLWCAPLTEAILQPGYKLLVLHGGQSHEANCLSEELGCPVYKAMWRPGLCYRSYFAAVISVLRFSGGHLSSFVA